MAMVTTTTTTTRGKKGRPCVMHVCEYPTQVPQGASQALPALPQPNPNACREEARLLLPPACFHSSLELVRLSILVLLSGGTRKKEKLGELTEKRKSKRTEEERCRERPPGLVTHPFPIQQAAIYICATELWMAPRLLLPSFFFGGGANKAPLVSSSPLVLCSHAHERALSEPCHPRDTLFWPEVVVPGLSY